MNGMQRCLMAGVVLLAAASWSAVQVDGVAAYANAHTITFSDVLGSSRELQQMLTQRRSGAEVNELYRRILDETINRKLILDAYEDQKLIRIPDGAIEERVENVIREMFDDDRIAFMQALATEGQSEQVWRAQIREQMIVQAMRNLQVDSQVSVSPVSVRERFESSAGRFSRPARVRFSMIVIEKGEGKREKLDEALEALAGGMGFAEAARRYSEDVRAADGGSRDWIAADMLREELRAVLMTLQPGAVGDVLEIGPNYSLVRVDEIEAAAQGSFDEAYADVERELRMEKSQRRYAEWVARLRRDAFVRVLNENPF